MLGVSGRSATSKGSKHMSVYTTAKAGDLFTGTNGQTGTVISVGATITVDTHEPVGYPFPYGTTRKLTFLYSAVPGEFTPAN